MHRNMHQTVLRSTREWMALLWAVGAASMTLLLVEDVSPTALTS